jgi:hypothetical protein
VPHTHNGEWVGYRSVSFWLLLIGVVLIVLNIFGVSLGGLDLFKVGVASCFASFLAP